MTVFDFEFLGGASRGFVQARQGLGAQRQLSRDTMVRSVAVLALLQGFAVALACSTDADCALNGACVSGACACDRAWTGPSCGSLSIDSGRAMYGSGATKDTSSWGGGPPVYDEATKKYNLFVSEIAANCGMGSWSRMSQAVRAVSDTLEGPYVRAGLVAGTQTHNTYYVYCPVTKKHLIYGIGQGDNPPSCEPYFKCTNGSTPGAQGLRPPAWPPSTCTPDMGPFVRSSDTLEGPWIYGGKLNFSGPQPRGPGAGNHNPAPLVFSNGTVLMLGRGKDAGAAVSASHRQINHNVWLYRASSWRGPYEWVPSNGVNGSIGVGNGLVPTEDPVLWQGRRGFHVLFHSGAGLTHGWSVDSINWDWNGNITGPQGQRPRVVLDDKGDIKALITSMLVPNFPGDDAAQTRIFLPV